MLLACGGVHDFPKGIHKTPCKSQTIPTIMGQAKRGRGRGKGGRGTRGREEGLELEMGGRDLMTSRNPQPFTKTLSPEP